MSSVWVRKTSYAVFTRDTFTRGKLTFLLYCVTFSIVKWHLPHVNVSRVNTALVVQLSNCDKSSNTCSPSFAVLLHIKWLWCCCFLRNSSKPLDLVVIDNLPSLLPRESSERFAEIMTPLLLKLSMVSFANGICDVWNDSRMAPWATNTRWAYGLCRHGPVLVCMLREQGRHFITLFLGSYIL